MSKRIYSDEMLNGFQQGSDAMSNGRLNHPDDIKKYFSSKTFKDFLADTTSPLVYCTLTVDGKPFLDKSGFSLHLDQKTNDHDSFTITVPDDALDSFQGYVMENSKNILGKNLTINLHRFGEIKSVFTGIIANVRNKKENGYGKLFITGSAPSILLENGKDCQSFEDKTLEQIIKEATSEYPEIAKVLVENPNTKYSLPYTVQYKESDYQFIKRLAARYGEYFYYNGQEMIFGNKVQLIVTLEENIDLIDVELEMNIRPQEFTYHNYDVRGGRKADKTGSSSQVQYKENPFQAIAINASKNVYKKNPDMLLNHTGISDNTDTELKEATRREKENRENLVQVKGKSKDPELKIGGRAKLIDINGKAMETYRITAITHYHDGNTYYNEFTGIPDLFNAPYQDNEALPLGEEQPARVVDNNDPMGMGRIRVQYSWQENKGEKTPWIRLIQPHSGAGKGFHFIPEIGEEVLVGHESQNAEKPFVMGTHYNGIETSSYHTRGNDKKVIHTRSGTKIILNDAEGSVFIEDPSGNTYLMDGNGNININAPKNMTFTAGDDINISAGKNMNTTVGNDHKINITNNHQFTSKNYNQTVNENKTVNITGDLEETTSKTTHKAKNGDILIQSAGVAKVLGKIDAKVNKG
ncbi:MAG TPA: contractile injection system protein, VgrG/Pvc8 family [Chryseobacterium sp.]